MMRSITLLSGLSLVALPVLAGVAAAAPAGPGACYDAVRTSTPSSALPSDLGAYCYNLRDGTLLFKAGQLPEALAAYERATVAARALADAEQRALAIDEIRGARAIVLAALGDAPGARSLLEQPRQARIDSLALLRAYFYARQGLYDEAATALQAARQALPDFWCEANDRALARLRRGEEVGEDATVGRDPSDWHYLPSYLHPAVVAGAACVTKGELGQLPLGKTFQISFDLGSADWLASARNAEILGRMAKNIETHDPGNNRNWTWLVIGHTDQSCPRAQKEPAGCAAYNQSLSERRARTIVEKLRQTLGTPGVRLKAEGYGMLKPLVDAGFGREEPRNRRVELTVTDATVSASAADCPWTVRVYDRALPVSTGQATIPSLVLQPEMAPLRVSRDAVYDIRFDPSKGQGWRHYSAISELSSAAKSDLAADGQLPGTALESLRDGGYRLPANPDRYFKVSSGVTLESIILSVSDRPVPMFEALRQARAGGYFEVTDASTNTAVFTKQLLGLTKGPKPTNAPDKIPQNLLFREQGNGPVANAKPVPPPVVAANLKSCRFTLSFL